MNTSVRWHKSDCSQPSITVDDGVPRCHSCGSTSSVLVAQLIAQNQAKGGGIHLPAETPLGEANLWWPPSVPYRSPDVDTRTDSEPSIDGKEATELSETDAEPCPVSSIYPSSLDSNHFRLIYLTETDDVSSPIHIQLDEYSLNDHPEYDTVSYLWGGEEGDSTPCKPVYVGSFWDTILATKNCSTVLHYLRPRRGCRLVWLDAICINQADNIEKPAQISRMADIYTNCERVVAYFGEDLVSQPPGRTFRPRIDFRTSTFADYLDPVASKSPEFHKACATSAGISVKQLFKRRYLTRIWIVQELLLSKDAIFPLGDLDILCEAQQAMSLIWGGVDIRQHDLVAWTESLFQLLKATSDCQASDPRDRVYGVLSLFQPQYTSLKLVSNYSISWRDCWLGTAAYLLLVEKNPRLLLYAMGSNDPTYMPSWVPDIEDPGSWNFDLFVGLHHYYGFGSSHVPSTRVTPAPAGFEEWATELVMHSEEEEKLHVKDFHDGQGTHCYVNPEALCTLSLESASIDSSTGALQLKAVRVFDRPCQLSMEWRIHGLTSIRAHGPSTAAHFRVLDVKEPMALDESYQLFIISCENRISHLDGSHRGDHVHNSVLLALTTMLSGNDSNLVVLDECFLVYDIHFYSMDRLEDKRVTPRDNLVCAVSESYDPEKETREFILENSGRVTNGLHSLRWVLLNLHEVVFSTLATKSCNDSIFACVFPSSKAKTGDLLPLIIHLNLLPLVIRLPEQESQVDLKWPVLAQSLAAVAENICPDFEPVVRGAYYYLTIKNNKMLWEMLSVWGKHYTVPEHEWSWSGLMPVSFYRTHSRDQEQWSGNSILDLVNELASYGDENEFPITIRFPWIHLLSKMRSTTLYTAMCHAREFSSLFDEDLETFLSRSPEPEDGFVFLQGWSQSLVEELGLVWKLERITIA